jgi:hypothetical protein
MAANFKSGDYGAPGNIHWGKYFRQLLVWIFIVSVMKTTMVLIMIVAHVPLVAISSFILSPFDYSAELKLVIVMVFTHLIMNMVQFWITDSFTKKKTPAAPQPSSVELQAKKKAYGDESDDTADDAKPTALAYENIPLTETPSAGV